MLHTLRAHFAPGQFIPKDEVVAAFDALFAKAKAEATKPLLPEAIRLIEAGDAKAAMRYLHGQGACSMRDAARYVADYIHATAMGVHRK